MSVPSQVISKKLKHQFLRTRGELMKRNFMVQAQNMIVSDWTLPKMLKIGQEEEKQNAIRDREMLKL